MVLAIAERDIGMNIQRAKIFFIHNFIFYLVGSLAVLGVKYYYSQADCDSLLWILAPTTRWVELLSGIPFTYISGTGYVNHDLRLWIAPSCSGVRFMVITMAMLIFSFVHAGASPKDTQSPTSVGWMGRGLCWIAASIIFSWLITILVNGLRIIAAIYLPQCLERAGLMRGMLTPGRLHTMIGVVVYFTALLIVYRLVDYVVQRKIGLISEKQFLRALSRKCVPPIFWYFLMTLGLPFLNRAYLNGRTEFTEFAVVVIGCMVLILLPYFLLTLLHNKRA